MISYNSFKKLIGKVGKVTSINGTAEYCDIRVIDDTITFRRNGKDTIERIDVNEMFRFYCEQPIENINTTMARSYISGRVQSPAVAILHKIYNDTLEQNRSFWGRIIVRWQYGDVNEKGGMVLGGGCLSIIFMFLIAIVINIGSFNNDIGVNETHVPCVIKKETVGSFNSNDIERVNEILYNEDEVSFMNYLAANIICQLHKGEKCVYIRYLKNNYVVIKTDSQIHPVIVSKDCLQRE